MRSFQADPSLRSLKGRDRLALGRSPTFSMVRLWRFDKMVFPEYRKRSNSRLRAITDGYPFFFENDWTFFSIAGLGRIRGIHTQGVALGWYVWAFQATFFMLIAASLR